MPGLFVPTGCSITEAVTILGNKLRDYQGQFNTTHLLALCDYFHNTFIRHYKLYQYVLGQDQEVNLTVIHLEVCLPPQPLPLSEGMDRELWKHEQQVAELSMAEVQKRTNVLLLKETLHLEQEHMLQKKFSEVLAQHTQVLKREVRLCLQGGRLLTCLVQTPTSTKRTFRLESDTQTRPPCLFTWEGAERNLESLSISHRFSMRISPSSPVRYSSCPHFNDETTKASENLINLPKVTKPARSRVWI